MSRTSITRDSFRRACSRFATGVAVATVIDSLGQPHGVTVNSFTSVSADPPLVLICIDRSCSILHLFQTSPGYVLNFLSEEQQDLSNRFAVLPEGRFQGVAWQPGSATGAPVLEATIGFMECTVREQIDAGDHIIFLAEVELGACSDGNPLLYFASSYRRLA